MNVALWIVQGLLAALFLVAGSTKATQPMEKMAPRMPYVEDFTEKQIRGIGILEILGAVGLILPGLTGILPWLTPWAAVGLILTMIGAALTHLRRGEQASIFVNVVLLALAAFVAYGRFFHTPL